MSILERRCIKLFQSRNHSLIEKLLLQLKNNHRDCFMIIERVNVSYCIVRLITAIWIIIFLNVASYGSLSRKLASKQALVQEDLENILKRSEF